METMTFSRVEKGKTINDGYEKYQSKINDKLYKEGMIDMTEFTSLYDQEEIQHDLQEMERTEKNLENIRHGSEEAKKKAELLEYIVFEQGELGEWFGKFIQTIKTCKYDDIKNSIDLILKLKKDQKNEQVKEELASYLGLAMDVTFERPRDIFGEGGDKFKRIIDEIDKDLLAEVKYFKADKDSPPEKLKNLPRVVLNIQDSTVDELIELWLNGDSEALASHWVQVHILYQISAQLYVYEEYARKHAKKKNVAKKLKDIYEEMEIRRLEKKAQFPRHAKAFNIDEMIEGYKNIIGI
jgi:hypothetical protein